MKYGWGLKEFRQNESLHHMSVVLKQRRRKSNQNCVVCLSFSFHFILPLSYSGVVGVDETVERGFCKSMNEHNKVISILALAEKAGMSTGFISTARATHATPASLYAHSADRNFESDKDLKSDANDDPSNCTDIGRWSPREDSYIKRRGCSSYKVP